ncbi:MAG: hypothetical protein HC767_12885, partial [Akkermansiaceae bacterium]|nr:hypothetical protein [Akkermansiaceae bacterium]
TRDLWGLAADREIWCTEAELEPSVHGEVGSGSKNSLNWRPLAAKKYAPPPHLGVG